MQKGDFVEIEYVGKVKETGELFDLTDEKLAKEAGVYNDRMTYGPVVIVVGANHVLAGLDKWLEKADVGKEIHIMLAPEEAFGIRVPEMIKLLPLAEFRKQQTVPQVGQILTFGNGIKGRILSIAGGRVKVDFNHPLASKTLEYKLTINRKIEDKDEQVKSILTYYIGKKLKWDSRLEGKKVTVIFPAAAKLPAEVKQRISDEIKKHVKEIETVDVTEKAAEKKAEQTKA